MPDGLGASRRQYMSGLASLAAAEWATKDYDIENAENWDPVTDGDYLTGEVSPEYVMGSASGTHAHMAFERDDLRDTTAHVLYNHTGVSVELGGSEEGEDDPVERNYVGALAHFTPDQARDLAVAIYMAAEELDRRPESGGT